MTDPGLRVAVDIGGTFTDLVVYDPVAGTMVEAKSPTTPADFSRGVLDVIEAGAVPLESVESLIHGTTVVINAITERTGARTALITTKGFRDVLAIGRGNRPDMYNLKYRKPEPFVPRRLRFEIDERVSRTGEVVRTLNTAELVSIATDCRKAGVEAVAICFLHAYAHPEHEREAAQVLSALLPGVPITISSDISREWREFERSSTAVLNAYVQPQTTAYIEHLEVELERHSHRGRRFVMISNGGTATFDHARDQPIQLVESGPAGGVIGAWVVGRSIGETNLITLDIGGTTAKCSIIVDGGIQISGDYRLEWTPLSPGYPARIPVIDIVEIGAGGGSVVWFDSAGALKIGPRSAGADPGPACYGTGGSQPTITDALVLAGYIEEGRVPGSNIVIDRQLARHAFEPIAVRLGVDVPEAVSGVLELFSAITVDALKLVSVRRGHDPRDFSLVAFGGGGPLHAAKLGSELGVKSVIIPRMPATFSAWGMLHANPRVDLTRTRVSKLDETGAGARSSVFAALESDARSLLVSQGFEPGQISSPVKSLDMRYQGQEHTVRVSIDARHDNDDLLLKLFNNAHKKMYTFSLEDTPVELVNYRLTLTAPLMSHAATEWVPREARAESAGRREIVIGNSAAGLDAAVYVRHQLAPGYSGEGPALIEETATTTVVPGGQKFTVDTAGNLIIRTIA